MKFREYQEVYNTTRKQVETVRLGDVSYIITCRIMQTSKDIEMWEKSRDNYHEKGNETMEEWCQGRIEGMMQQKDALKECLRLIEKTAKI